MAHNNGRIYINTSTSPAQGISVYDVQDTIGASDKDIGNLCKHANINPYAKYKPVRYSTLATPTDAQRKVINYGIKAPLTSVNPADTKQTAWEYQKPRGKGGGTNGADEWYRIRDYEEYYHTAVSPITCRGDIEITEAGGAEPLAVFNNSVGSMTFQDYGTLEGYYLAVYLVGRVTTLPYLKTASAPFGDLVAPTLSLEYNELPPVDFPDGTAIEYYLCLCDTKKETLLNSSDPNDHGLPAGANYLPLPYFGNDTISSFIGTFTKIEGYDVRMTFDMVFTGNDAPADTHFTASPPPPPNYFSALPSPELITDIDRYYLNTYNSTSLKVRFTLTYAGNSVDVAYLYANLSPTYYGSPTTRRKVEVYKYENNVVSKVTHGTLVVGTKYIATLYDSALLLNSSNAVGGPVPATLMRLRTVLTLYDGAGEDDVKIGSVGFGIRNQ